MKLFKSSIFFLCLFFLLPLEGLLGQEQNIGEIKKTIATSVGFNKWNETRYILFSSSSNVTSNNSPKERKFLLDKSSGNVRYEGMDNNNDKIVFIFNFKSKKGIKYFINDKESNENANNSTSKDIIDQFFEDVKFLFFPVLVSSSNVQLSLAGQKIINTEKLNIINFSNLTLLDNQPISGQLYATQKGELKQFYINNEEYVLSDLKDIGGGIILASSYGDKLNKNLISFTTIAAFTDIESGKFSNP